MNPASPKLNKKEKEGKVVPVSPQITQQAKLPKIYLNYRMN